MEALYELTGISRQAFFENEGRNKVNTSVIYRLLDCVKAFRIDHPRMGARKIYHKMSKNVVYDSVMAGIGRDKFEMILLNNDMRVGKTKNFLKTTVRGAYIFKNLLVNFEPTAADQVWVSDLTYFFVVEQGRVKHYYLTLIMDKFTRQCIGYAVSSNMTTEATTLPALEMAIKKRGIGKDYRPKRLILHSDGGGQYSDKAFLAFLKTHGILSSMGKQAYENPNAERLNGILKNEYLLPWGVNSLCKLQELVPKAVKLYNNERPHFSLNYFTPVEFEMHLKAKNSIP